MTSFEILLANPLLGASTATAAIATVRRVAKDESETSRWRTQVPVQAGSGRGTTVSVPTGGTYDIELVTPSGRVFAEQLNVAEGEVKPVAFTLGESPHEWLSWQQLSGFVPKRAQYEREGRDRPPRGPQGSDGHPEIREAVIPRDRSMWARVIVSANRPRSQSGSGFVRRRDESRGRYGAIEVEPRPLRKKVFHTDSDERVLQWLIEPDYAWGSDPEEWARWGFVVVDQVKELVTIPTPWAPDSVIEVSFDRARPRAMAFTTVMVRDPAIAGVLGYLGSGRTGYANLIIEGGDYAIVERLIHDKMGNPIAAAGAAAIAALSTRETARQRWDPWLDNLANSFPWLPDGAVVLAHRRLQQAQSEEDFDRARELFVTAFDRGIPYYVAALSMLSGGLGQFAEESQEIADRYRETVAALSLVDPHQPFVVIRLAGKPEVSAHG